KFYSTYARLVHESEEERAVILKIEKGKIAPVTKKNMQLEIDQYPYLEKLRNNNQTLKAIEKYRKNVSSINSSHSGFMAYSSTQQQELNTPAIQGKLKAIAEAEKVLLEKEPQVFKAYKDLELEIADGKLKESEYANESTSKRNKLLKNVLHYSTASGLNGSVAIGNVIHYYFPNQLSTGGKLSMFFGNIWRFLSEDPRHANTEGGVFPAIIGTLMMTILMCIFVTPFGVVAAIFLHEYAKQGPVVRVVRIAINNLAGVPSIVYGAFGLAFFVYYVGGSIDELFFSNRLGAQKGPLFGTGGMLWASLTLALLTVPVVIVATEEALAAVPRGIREGALGCGASKWQMIKTTVLPASAPGIITGMILAMARGAGEVAPLMLVGVADIASELPISTSFPFGVENKFLHLGYNIYHVGFKTVDSEASRPLVFATTLLLITIIALLNLTGIIIRQRLRKKYSSGAF
ncbi:MAG: phosphate ABC transporter permease PstA, partial [Lentisphaeraceae bacterium]|nr:phosphate ABC transporter permease PstA [Lentisphaeraceae bacterium]